MRGGECPVSPPVHRKGVALPRQRSLRKLKTLSNCKGFYSVVCATERFLYLRDFFYYFDRSFNLCLRDFLKIIFKDLFFGTNILAQLCLTFKMKILISVFNLSMSQSRNRLMV